MLLPNSARNKKEFAYKWYQQYRFFTMGEMCKSIEMTVLVMVIVKGHPRPQLLWATPHRKLRLIKSLWDSWPSVVKRDLSFVTLQLDLAVFR